MRKPLLVGTIFAAFILQLSIFVNLTHADSGIPDTPTLSMQLDGNKLVVYWSEAANAAGYALSLAPYPTFDSKVWPQAFDMGTYTGLDVGEDAKGYSFYVAVRAYNRDSNGNYTFSSYSNVGAFASFYRDADMDNYGDPNALLMTLSDPSGYTVSQPSGYVFNNKDNNDSLNNNDLILLSSDDVKNRFGDGLYAQISTNKGLIVCQLEFEKAPLTVTNFVGLAEGTINHSRGAGVHYYDGLTFHRVINDFMIQGGCPFGTGTGGPGYTFKDELNTGLTHSGAGILSMANSGTNTNGSQFFITHLATPWLDGKHTVFGHVVLGQDVVNSIQAADVMGKIVITRVGYKALSFKSDQTAFDILKN